MARSQYIRGGDRFEAALHDLSQKLDKRGQVKVGFLENATYPDGKKVAMIAAIQDFGAPARGIPPRPFFRNMVAAKQAEWPGAIAGLLRANGNDVQKTLEQTGAAIAGQLRQSIVDTNDPPLKPATIKRKGFEKPLIDTGHMLQSVDYAVEVEE